MPLQMIKPDVFYVGANDKNRKLFDALIPLPDGTTYNSYLIIGSDKIALIDTVEPSKKDVFLKNINDSKIERVDYIIANHAEQDHSGCIPLLIEKYPNAMILCNEKCKSILMNFFTIPEEKYRIVKDREVVDLGGKSLEFIYTPWVHWPETMVTYYREEKILFSCDFFGSHLAEDDILNSVDEKLEIASKRYYSTIMMPYRMVIKKNLEILKNYEIKIIAPSHGPVFLNPSFIMNSYNHWVNDEVKNVAVIIYVSMHGSTEKMALVFAESLRREGVEVRLYNLEDYDCGQVAMDLVDAATLVVGTPCFHTGLHPRAHDALYFINSLRPKTKFLSVIGSFEWASKITEDFEVAIKHVKAEILKPIIVTGYPSEGNLQMINELAQTIAKKHKELNLR